MKGDWLLTSIIVNLPDLAIAWAVMKLTDDHTATFWWTLAAIWGVGLLYSIKGLIAASLLFRLIGRRRLTDAAANFLSANNFPAREGREDIDGYLERIADDERQSVDIRLLATAEAAKLELLESQAILPVLRVRKAYDAALQHHRPSLRPAA